MEKKSPSVGFNLNNNGIYGRFSSLSTGPIQGEILPSIARCMGKEAKVDISSDVIQSTK